MSALETKLRGLAASLDAGALEALANKGLLRRAQKDLERGATPSITRESDNKLHLKVGEFEVQLPESGPAAAACSCPAAGVCQHILVAILFLQQDSSSEIIAKPHADPIQEWMSISPEQLEKWAGKTTFNAGLKLAARHPAQIHRESAVRIRFPELNSEVHFVAQAGLDGAIVAGGKGGGRQLVVAAIVAVQRAQGVVWNMPADAALESSDGAPRTRSEVLESCAWLLAETLSNGLSRISPSNQQRWATLAVSALGVSLPRLALSLRGIGQETSLIVERAAGSDLSRMLARMAQTHALCSALQNGGENPRPDLVGMHRTRYNEVGHLDLAGAAAWPWRTSSGYEGLTVLLWDSSAKIWNSWSDSRPRHQLADFRPVARYIQASPWEGAESPRQLSKSSFRLMHARRNANFRLSSSSKSRVLVTGPALPNALQPITLEDWAELANNSRADPAAGLKEPNLLDAIVVVKPSKWADRGFDQVAQNFVWLLLDKHGAALPMQIPFDDLTEPAIKFLETVPPASLSDAAVIGRVDRSAAGVTLLPYSIHYANGDILNLCLDTTKPSEIKQISSQEPEDESIPIDEEPSFVLDSNPSLNRFLDDLDDQLLAVAERGFGAFQPLRMENVQQFARRLEPLGWNTLTNNLAGFTNQPTPHLLLRCVYLSQLHRRTLLVA